MAEGNTEAQMNISASPHIRSGSTTTGIMLDVIIALIPASVMGVWQFGVRAALMILICVVACMTFEYLSELLMKRRNTVRDLSAVVTGLLLALNLPVELPYWMAVLGCLFAIVVVKQLFGGIGQNFMNPALAGRCFLMLSFAGHMTRFTLDAVTTATNLSVLRTEGLGAVSVWDMFLGTEAGTIGECSAAALLAGAAYLLIRRVIRLTIPVFYIGSFAICLAIYCLVQEMTAWNTLRFISAHLCGGGLMLGACFMATDYVTSPITGKGRMLYGCLLGLLTFCFRIYGSSTEGVSYAIIIGNLLVPIIEMITKPKAFGKGYEKKSISENRGFLEPVALDEEGRPVRKKEAGIFRITFTICAIALLAGGLLGTVYAVTKDPIAKTAEKKQQEAYRAVMPDGDSYTGEAGEETREEYILPDGTADMDKVNEELEKAGFTKVTVDYRARALSGDTWVGDIWIITSHEGYAGDIKMAIGLRGTEITGIRMLSIGETNGLGMEARDDPSFTAQYTNKQVDSFTVVKNAPEKDEEIQAITGATITSKAVTNAVNAVIAAEEIMIGEGGTQYEQMR